MFKYFFTLSPLILKYYKIIKLVKYNNSQKMDTPTSKLKPTQNKPQC